MGVLARLPSCKSSGESLDPWLSTLWGCYHFGSWPTWHSTSICFHDCRSLSLRMSFCLCLARTPALPLSLPYDLTPNSRQYIIDFVTPTNFSVVQLPWFPAQEPQGGQPHSVHHPVWPTTLRSLDHRTESRRKWDFPGRLFLLYNGTSSEEEVSQIPTCSEK